MNRMQELVEEFHRETGSTIGKTIDIRDRELRAKLILEEAVETAAALGFEVHAQLRPIPSWGQDGPELIAAFHKSFAKPNLVEYIDGMCDLLYVTFGSAVSAGVNLAPHFEEVHRANMTKLAGPKREDGKQLKPEGWQPPDHDTLIVRANNADDIWNRFLQGEEEWKQRITNWLRGGRDGRTEEPRGGAGGNREVA